jgi:replicative DNA helicase
MNHDTYHEYLQSDQWKSIRLLALKRAGHRCQVCNNPEHLDAHHRTYERLGAEHLDDVTILCGNCHDLFTERSKRSAGAVTVQEALNETHNLIDARRKGDFTSVNGVPTGFIDLDNLTAGLQNSELIIVAARPSVGKTAFALNIVRHVAVEKQMTVLFVSLEHPRRELAQRLLCCQARVDSHRLRTGRMPPEDMSRLSSGGDMLAKSKIFITDTPVQSMPQIAADARRMKADHDLRLLVVDTLNLIDPDFRKDSRQEQVAAITRRLKLLARELNIPVVAVAQLNRSSEDRLDHRPRLSDVRESGAIEQDPDTVLLLHRPDFHEPGSHEGLVEVIIAKQRNGPTGEVSLIYLKQYMRFENFAVEHPTYPGI